MDLGIAGKWALVCGASKGLGYGCAQALVKEGVNVLIVARGAEALEDAAGQLQTQASAGAQVQALAADITSSAGRAMVFALRKDFDIVVTNAGGPPPGDLTTIAGLRAAFSDDWVFAAAWAHYLVFDMVVGAWIARDAVRLGIPWPLRTIALLLTFLAGPVGFLLHLVTRFVLRRAVATDGVAVTD